MRGFLLFLKGQVSATSHKDDNQHHKPDAVLAPDPIFISPALRVGNRIHSPA